MWVYMWVYKGIIASQLIFFVPFSTFFIPWYFEAVFLFISLEVGAEGTFSFQSLKRFQMTI